MELLTIKAAATYLGLSRTSIYALIDRGDIKPIRLLKDAPRILRDDLDALVQKARADADTTVGEGNDHHIQQQKAGAG